MSRWLVVMGLNLSEEHPNMDSSRKYGCSSEFVSIISLSILLIQVLSAALQVQG